MRWIEKLRARMGAASADVTVALFTAVTAVGGLTYHQFFESRSPAVEERELRLLAMRHDSVMLALRSERLRALGHRFGEGVRVPELALPSIDSTAIAEVVGDDAEEGMASSPSSTSGLHGDTLTSTSTTRSDTLQLGTGPIAPPISARTNDGPPTSPIDINTAPLEQLERLPGVGEVLARRIIEQRRRERFGRVEDVMKVKGIGEGKFTAMRRYITVR